MRLHPQLRLLLTILLPAVSVGGDEKSGDRTPPTDRQVIELVGKDFAQVFARFGTPADIIAVAGPKNSLETVLDFGSFGFNIQNKKVRICQFWSDFPGTVDGIKLGTRLTTSFKNWASRSS